MLQLTFGVQVVPVRVEPLKQAVQAVGEVCKQVLQGCWQVGTQEVPEVDGWNPAIQALH